MRNLLHVILTFCVFSAQCEELKVLRFDSNGGRLKDSARVVRVGGVYGETVNVFPNGQLENFKFLSGVITNQIICLGSQNRFGKGGVCKNFFSRPLGFEGLAGIPYVQIVEILSVSGSVALYLGDTGNGQSQLTFQLVKTAAIGTNFYQNVFRKADFSKEGEGYLERAFAFIAAGEEGCVSFRESLYFGTTVNAENYQYVEPGAAIIAPLPIPERKGYAFVGWRNESGEYVSNETIVKSRDDDLVLLANWKRIAPLLVEGKESMVLSDGFDWAKILQDMRDRYWCGAQLFFGIIVFILYWMVLPSSVSYLRVCLLLAMSLMFAYWLQHGLVVILLISVAANYLIGSAILRRIHAKLILLSAIALNVLALCLNKYTTIIPALGMSYLTFVQIAFLVECYRKGKRLSFHEYFLSVVFWPKLISGPIVRPDRFVSYHSRRFATAVNYRRVYLGLVIFFIGIAKKLLLADNLATIVNAGWSEPLNAASSWLVTGCYSLQLYFDFSGYSDMAWGVSMFFGIRLPFNFNSPYKALTIQDFWRRWHISLSLWLRDYLYFTFGGSRKGLFRTMVNVFLTFLIGGVWHGVGWTFIIWGALHGLALAVNNLWRKLISRKMPKIVSWLFTIMFVHMAWVFFRAPDASSAITMLQHMFGLGSRCAAHGALQSWSTYVLVGVSALICCLPNSNQIAFFALRRIREWRVQFALGVISALFAVAAVLRMCNESIEMSKFIYSQF